VPEILFRRQMEIKSKNNSAGSLLQKPKLIEQARNSSFIITIKGKKTGQQCGRRDRDEKVWELSYRDVLSLGLEDRIIRFERGKKG
jgi:hypothetical protein